MAFTRSSSGAVLRSTLSAISASQFSWSSYRRSDSAVMVYDFRRWLERYGDEHAELCRDLAAVDCYFVTLSALRTRLTELFDRYFALKVVA